MFQIKKAARSKSKMRIGLFGPSGSGKTYSAILLAKGLIGDLSKLVIIDTENGSADLYDHLGDYSTLPLKAPYSPQRYMEAISFCEKNGFECMIIDSISHEWEGTGGCLDIHASLGSKFEHWAKVTPLHQKFLTSIVASSCHVIATGRSKTDYNFESKSAGGKGKVEKIGTKTVTREGFDYELTVAFQINQDHFSTIDKDRTDMFRDVNPFMINEETGIMIREWNEKGIVGPENFQKKIEIILDYLKKFSNNYKDKETLNSLMSSLGVTSSKEILSCTDKDKFSNWITYLQSIEEDNNNSIKDESEQLPSIIGN